MKKILIKTIALALTLLLSTTGVFAAVPEDVSGEAYEEAVTALMDKGIITGDSDGNFNPEAVLTRAQACIIIVKSMNPLSSEVVGTATQSVAKSGFSDMTGYGWADGYVSYAVKTGVTKGYPDGTFKPGNSVTMNELVTMVLRAADYSDDTLGGTWPSNYMEKAVALNLLEGTPETLPTDATKWIAAQVDYNALDLIEKANPQEEEASTDQETPTGVPDTADMKYADGGFNSAMTAYNGKTIGDDVTVYTYGLEKNYNSTMTFSEKAADYHLDTVYKYKNVETPVFYQVENDEITSMIIPGDVGFSGLAYAVITGTYSTTNAEGKAVTGLKTIAAGKSIKWLCEKSLTGIPSKAGNNSYLTGTIFEIKLDDGVVQSIYKSTESHRGDIFDELSGADFAEITSYDDNVVELDSGDLIEIKDNATIYVLDNEEYKVGKQSNIKDGNEIRIYDMSDDDETSGDIVVVTED